MPDWARTGEIAHVEILADRVDRLGDVVAVRMAIDHDAGAALAAEELIERQAGGLRFDVPERCVDSSNRGHGHRAAPPVDALSEVVPRVLDLMRIAADQQWDDVIAKVGCDRQLSPVQRRVADTMDALVGHDLERDEVPARAGDDHFGVDDFHKRLLTRRRHPPTAARSRPSFFSAFKQMRILPLEQRQRSQDFGEMRADSVFCGHRVACLDRVDDRGVLLHEPLDRRGSRQAQITHAVHLRLHLLHDTPGVVAVDAEREGAVKGLVERQKARRFGIARCFALRVEDFPQLRDIASLHNLAGFSGNRDLHRLAHEASVRNLLGGNLHDEGAALRTDPHQTGLAELDERLADGLAAHAETGCDLSLR